MTGCTHTGKTWLAQQLLATYHIPYLSIDHLKMGLIRSGKIPFTPQEDAGLTEALWPILREICKTVLENRQHLVIEGCDIPFDWRKDFNDVELREIQSCCLLMSADYIKRHFQEIRDYANVIERRLDDSDCTMALLLQENANHYALCQKYHCPYLWVDQTPWFWRGEIPKGFLTGMDEHIETKQDC